MITRTLRSSALSSSALFLLLFAAPPFCAASHLQSADAAHRMQEEEKGARKFDEFLELLGECSLGARLDNLAIQLQTEPESRGFIIVYTGKYDLPARVSLYRERIGDYLINARGIAPERLVVLDGGPRQLMTTELWIVAKEADPPVPTDTIDVKRQLEVAYKFGEQNVHLRDDSEQFPEEAETIEDAEVGAAAEEEVAAAGEPVEAQEDAAAEPQEEVPEEKLEVAPEEETVDYDIWWASENYARALQVEAGARGCIIFYADREQADFSRVKELVERAKKRLIEKYGVKDERLLAIFGGYRSESQVELWIVPPRVSLPVPTADPAPEEKTDKPATKSQR